MSYFPEFSAQLEALLRRTDRSQSWLAQRLGVHRSTVGRWLNDATRPNSPEDIVRIGDLLGVSGEVQTLLAAAGYGVSLSIGPEQAESRKATRPLLPPMSTALIGREVELAQIRRYVADPAIRLITLLGVGGVGKSSLALAAAHALAPDFADGAWFVPLADVQDNGEIASAICDALDLRAQADLPAATHLRTTLADQHLLLVLDNFEHLLDGADLLAQLMAAAPHLTLLVTSRVRLALREEWRIDLRGLAFPEESERPLPPHSPGADSPPQGEHAAVTLLTKLIRQHRADFTTGPTENPTVDPTALAHMEAICRLVEGIPLALEMVAPWVRTLPLAKIPTILVEQGDRVLANPARNAPKRHRSMRAVFEQSWALLSQEEQTALARLAVFRGGCRPEAAAAVTDAEYATFASLIDRSLLSRTAKGRYHIHELIRQFSAQKLALDPEELARTRLVHAQTYAAFLQQREADITSQEQALFLAEIQADLDNIRALWSWAVSAASEDEMTTVLSAALHGYFYFCEVRGYAPEGCRLLQNAIDRLRRMEQAHGQLTDTQSLLLGRILGRRGWLMARMGETYDSVLAQMDEGVARLRASQTDTRWEQLFILRYATTPTQMARSAQQLANVLSACVDLANDLGNARMEQESGYSLAQARQFQGRFAEACDILASVRPFFEARQDRRRLAFVDSNWGRSLLGMGAWTQAAEHFEQAHILREDLADPIGIGFSQIDWGRWWEAKGDFGESIERLHRALDLVETHRQAYLIALCHQALGDLYRIVADPHRSAYHYRASMAIHKSRGNRLIQAGNLNGLGLLALEKGDLAVAEGYFQQSLHDCQEQGSLATGAGAAIGLARCEQTRAEGSTEQAIWGHLHKAWGWANVGGAVPIALHGLAVAAQSLHGSAQKRLRTQLAHHPALPAETKKAFSLNSAGAEEELITPWDVWEVVRGLGHPHLRE